MFCTKCGTENPDGSGFCCKCGSPLTQSAAEPQAQPVQPVQPTQPTQPDQNAAQPVYQQPQYQQPYVQQPQPQYQQPYAQQPQQFQQPQYQQPYAQQPQYQQPYGQPAYGAPYYQQGMPKKSKTVPIVIGVCAAVVVVFLVVLFAVILPNAGGTESKLKHRWTYNGEYIDLKNNTYTDDNDRVYSMKWELKGDDRIWFEIIDEQYGNAEWEYLFTLSDDGNRLTFKDVDDPSWTYDFIRVD